MSAERRVVVDMNKVEKVFIEMAKLKAIVRDLAAGEEDEEARLEEWVTVQLDRGAWDRAREWVQAQEHNE